MIVINMQDIDEHLRIDVWTKIRREIKDKRAVGYDPSMVITYVVYGIGGSSTVYTQPAIHYTPFMNIPAKSIVDEKIDLYGLYKEMRKSFLTKFINRNLFKIPSYLLNGNHIIMSWSHVINRANVVVAGNDILNPGFGGMVYTVDIDDPLLQHIQHEIN